MSSFILGKVHIDAMLTAAIDTDGVSGLYVYHDGRGQKVNHDTVDYWGAELVAENVRSVRGQYGDITGSLEGAPGPTDNQFAVDAVKGIYRFERTESKDPVEILNAILCYEYQSDDHDMLDSSPAGAFCRYLKNSLIHRLPGADGVWEITERGRPLVSLYEMVRGRG